MKPEQTLTPQELFLRQQTQKKRQIRAARILLLAAFLILWETAAAFGWIDSFIFSALPASPKPSGPCAGNRSCSAT
mgnify:CR=1 FL=1